MDDRAGEWLGYLESLKAGAESNLRIRRAVAVPFAVALLIGSVLFIYAGGALALGLIGIGVAALVLGFSAVYTLRNIVFVAGSDTIIRRILLGQLKESREINDELDKLIRRAASRSAIAEGRRVFRDPAGKRP